MFNYLSLIIAAAAVLVMALQLLVDLANLVASIIVKRDPKGN